MEILLSILIVTRNRPDSLERTLLSLTSQDYKPFEVIISDDSDIEELIESNKRLAHKYGVGYITGPRNGLYANRNHVAKKSRGTHFRTMDDDHEFPAMHFQECIKAIIESPDAILTIGEYFPSDYSRPLPAPVPGQLHPRGFSYKPQEMSMYYGISCGATIYPKEVVDRNILNSELYKFGILYLEYGARLSKLGYSIKHIQNTYVIHHYDEGKRSESSMKIINGARIFSMLMLSFEHKPTLINKFLTITELFKGWLKKEHTISMIRKASKNVSIYRTQKGSKYKI
jgi:glycosyltransferase involved in cell wall biosynthesis